MSTVLQAYRFALDPNPGQDDALRSHCGGQRYTYNWGPPGTTGTPSGGAPRTIAPTRPASPAQ
jgi:hypothetical protein